MLGSRYLLPLCVYLQSYNSLELSYGTRYIDCKNGIKKIVPISIERACYMCGIYVLQFTSTNADAGRDRNSTSGNTMRSMRAAM